MFSLSALVFLALCRPSAGCAQRSSPVAQGDLAGLRASPWVPERLMACQPGKYGPGARWAARTRVLSLRNRGRSSKPIHDLCFFAHTLHFMFHKPVAQVTLIRACEAEALASYGVVPHLKPALTRPEEVPINQKGPFQARMGRSPVRRNHLVGQKWSLPGPCHL